MILRDQRKPQQALSVTESTTADESRTHAATFFLGWLILAASMSVAGNVGHALLIAPSDTRELAALGALVPPIVLLAATHSAAWLVRARSAGWVYWVALALTAALALGSFALSFDALRSFAVMLGIRESMSWIWPAVIDIAIAHATLCLLSLSTPRKRAEPECKSADTEKISDTATKAAKLYHENLAGTSPASDHPDEPQPSSAELPMPSAAPATLPSVKAKQSSPTIAQTATSVESEFAAAPSLPSAAAAAATEPPRWQDRSLTAVPARKPDPSAITASGGRRAEHGTRRDLRALAAGR